MMLNDEDNLGIAQNIIDVIMIVQQFVERVDIRKVVVLDHDTLHGEVRSLFLLCLKTNALTDPRGWD
jgi:hypothetical protein